MSQTSVTEDLSSYNAKAIEVAAKLTEHRRQVKAQDKAEKRPTRPLDQILSPVERTALGVKLEYERMGNQPISSELQSRAEALGVTYDHLGLTVGTVIGNVDLRTTPSAELTKVIRDTLLERKVIFFHDQDLDEEQHVAFARQFGDLDAFPFGKPGHNPFILEIIHGEGSPGTENGWHTDVTWMERPSLGSIAQCVELPPFGGDTLFADSHAAYLGLPTETKERIQHLAGINDYRVFIAGRGQGAMPHELVDELKHEIPFGVHHPLVRTHPETGKNALYIHGGFLRHESLYDTRTNKTLDPDEAREICRTLLAQHARPEYSCRFAWRQGSIAFWDNRAVQHYAASDYYPHRRVLRRVTVSGDEPVNDPNAS